MEKELCGADGKGVLLIYTGGTIGSLPLDPDDPASPLAAAPWEMAAPHLPGLEGLRRLHPVDVVQTRRLIDSTNMRPGYWLEMAEIIADNYEKYNGFVILHGTDTMAYTASALSFMLENLGKPVVLTGSQLPVAGRCRNDAEQNLYTAVMIANGPRYRLPAVPEVCIFFRDKLLRGNRARKISASGYSGFDSPNYPPLGRAGEHIVIEKKYLRRPPGGPFRLRRGLDAGVIAFTVFPGVQDGQLLEKVADLPGLRGLVLQSYGTGNAPTEPGFLKAVERATREKGLVLLNVTQCLEGFVEPGAYETGAALLDRGVAGGADITPEAALCKLMVLLGDKALSAEDIKERVWQNLAGEQSLSVLHKDFSGGAMRLQGPEARADMAGDVPGGWGAEHLVRAFVRLKEASLAGPEGEAVEIGLYIGLAADEPAEAAADGADENAAGKAAPAVCAGSFRRQAGRPGNGFVFEISGPALAHVRPGESLSLLLTFTGSPGHELRWQGLEVVLYLGDWERP